MAEKGGLGAVDRIWIDSKGGAGSHQFRVLGWGGGSRGEGTRERGWHRMHQENLNNNRRVTPDSSEKTLTRKAKVLLARATDSESMIAQHGYQVVDIESKRRSDQTWGSRSPRLGIFYGEAGKGKSQKMNYNMFQRYL